MFKRLFGILSGGLLGYVWGWIWGWSLVDPNLDYWAAAAAFGALVGLGVGLSGIFWQLAPFWASATIGLYLGWVLRTLIFGDVPGGFGMLLMVIGAAEGIWLTGRLKWQNSQRALRVLLAIVYAGFFGGFLVDVLLLDKGLGLASVRSITGQSVAVIICGALGGVVAAFWRR
jgi:hypothetical protein